MTTRECAPSTTIADPAMQPHRLPTNRGAAQHACPYHQCDSAPAGWNIVQGRPARSRNISAASRRRRWKGAHTSSAHRGARRRCRATATASPQPPDFSRVELRHHKPATYNVHETLRFCSRSTLSAAGMPRALGPEQNFAKNASAWRRRCRTCESTCAHQEPPRGKSPLHQPISFNLRQRFRCRSASVPQHARKFASSPTPLWSSILQTATQE